MRTQKRSKKSQKGFTYVEWIAIILIGLILLALIVALALGLRERIREGNDVTAIHASYKRLAYDAIGGDIPIDPKTNEYDYSGYTVKLTQTRIGWQKRFDFPSNLVSEIAPALPLSTGAATCEFRFDSDTRMIVMSLAMPKSNWVKNGKLDGVYVEIVPQGEQGDAR